MSRYHELLESAQDLLISIVEARLHRLKRLVLEDDSDVEMSDLEVFGESGPVDLHSGGKWHLMQSETYVAAIQNRHFRI